MMRLDPNVRLFIGVIIDANMRAALAAKQGPQRAFFEGGSDVNLTILHSEEKSYIGRVIEGTLSTSDVDDLKRNVLSILLRQLPDQKLPRECTIFACATDALPAARIGG
jgi:hypothetical protein